MLLNAMSGNNNSHKWSVNEFYNYISFLEKAGCSKELIDILVNIYSKNPINDFSLDVLESIDTSKDYTLKMARIHKSKSTEYYG